MLGAVSRKYAHKIPFLVKLNHNEILSYPNKYDQVMFGCVKQAFDMGAVAIGATIYFGSPECDRQLHEVSKAFAHAHELGRCCTSFSYVLLRASRPDHGPLAGRWLRDVIPSDIAPFAKPARAWPRLCRLRINEDQSMRTRSR